MDEARRRLAARLKLHVLTDRSSSRGRDLLAVARAALAGGATVIQLRDKTACTSLLLEEGRALRALTRAYNALLIVNDRVDVALALDADGVHLGQDDLPAHLARQLLGPERILGLSAGNFAEANAALAAGADYLGIGPIFGTQSKADAGAPIGTQLLSELAARSILPLVAIGGITAENATVALQAGASGIAVISAVTSADDCMLATRRLADLYSPAKEPDA
ncbi:MAG TPA: thiamine phosphate synthase [Ktedonobacteraceae bacterium]|jgi:thiamine-phosphate pyrophosphorylase|nr:thiamine phosphate synthase [Ktedonobacteraceae bacterium]